MFKNIINIQRYFKNKDNRNLFLNVLGNYFIKGGSMIVSFLIMPAYMKYFESQAVLGMWFTIIQLLNWIMLLDFGIGGGLRNKIIEPLQKGNEKRVKQLLSSTYLTVGIIVIILIVLQHFIVNFLDWHKILGISYNEISSKTMIDMVHILIIGVCVRFFSVLICHVLYALQKAVMPSFISLMSSVFIMLYLLIVNPTGTEIDVIKLSYINSIANNIPALIATIWLFKTKLKNMFPSYKYFSWDTAKEVLGTGGTLFYLQIIIMVLFNVKELYISWFVGAEAVVDYQVYYKLIGMVGGLFSLALNPVWSAVTKAIVEKKDVWIRELYKKGVLLILLFGIGQFLIIILLPFVVRVWLGENSIYVSRIDGLLFCLYNLIYMWMMLNYNFACGMGRTRTISIWLTIAGISNLLLTIWACNIYRDWITVVVATAIAAIPCAIFVQKDIFNAIKNINKEKGELYV